MDKHILEIKIKKLNDWLLNPANEKLSDYRIKLHERNYLVEQLIQIEEYGE